MTTQAQEDCREVLGSDDFEALVNEVDALPDDVDRDAVFAVIRQRAYKLRGFAVLDPGWCKDRDKALDNIRQAIMQFKRVLRESPWLEQGVSEEEAFVETWAGGLEREYKRLVEPEDIGDYKHKPFLTLSLVNLGFVSPAGGRPKTGVREDILALQALGVPVIAAEGLLAAAGLTVPRA